MLLSCQDDTGRRHFPFGEGFAKIQSAIPNAKTANLVQLPISVAMNEAVDDAKPLTYVRPKGSQKELSAFHELAVIVARELLHVQYGSPSDDQEYVVFENETTLFELSTTTLALDKGKERFGVRLFSDAGAVQKHVSPAKLRASDPRTGETIPNSPHLDQDGDELNSTENDPMVTRTRPTQKRSPSVLPTKVERRGRYGFAVEWGDGATIIYSMRCLAKVAGGTITELKP